MERKDFELIELTDCEGHDGATIQLPPGLVVVSPDHQGFAIANGAEIVVSVPTAEFKRLVEEGALIASPAESPKEAVEPAPSTETLP